MNFSFSRFSNGAAKVGIIFKLPNFFAKIFHFLFSCLSLLKNSQPHQPPVFQMGVQRYDLYFNLQDPVIILGDEKTPKNSQQIEFSGVKPLLQFC